MLKVRWTSRALNDLVRLHAFLVDVNPEAASRLFRTLSDAPARLRQMPRLGERLEEYAPQEVRKLLIDKYEMWYEVAGSEILVLRLWHTREDRRSL